jgi:hypothetical protein
MTFKTIVKMKTGGSVAKAAEYAKRDRKEVDTADIAQDKKIVKKAINMHDKQQHEAPTDLTGLKKGGRAKKAVGTVKKYCSGSGVKGYCGGKGVKKYAEGKAVDGSGSVLDTIKGVGKRLYENVMGTPEQNAAAQARLDKYEASKKAAVPSAPVAKKRGGKC